MHGAATEQQLRKSGQQRGADLWSRIEERWIGEEIDRLLTDGRLRLQRQRSSCSFLPLSVFSPQPTAQSQLQASHPDDAVICCHCALLSLCSSIWHLLTLSQLNRRVVFSSGSAPVGILTCMHVEPCGTFWS